MGVLVNLVHGVIFPIGLFEATTMKSGKGCTRPDGQPIVTSVQTTPTLGEGATSVFPWEPAAIQVHTAARTCQVLSWGAGGCSLALPDDCFVQVGNCALCRCLWRPEKLFTPAEVASKGTVEALTPCCSFQQNRMMLLSPPSTLHTPTAIFLATNYSVL